MRPMDERMGELFAGRYELLDEIGRGGMGSVWRARDRRSGGVVAAKVLRSGEAAAMLRFVREQAVRVEHPNIVVPIGWAGEDDRVLFTMPVVAGGSVATLVGDFGPLPARLVAEILRQLLSAIEAVHAARLVHRDVKPENVLLDPTGGGRPHAYLSDFGIAVDLDGPRLTETGLVTGTPGYLAPELRALGDPTPAADLYSLGMVAANMLTALPPRDIDLAERPEGVPASLWAVVTELARVDPAQRPSPAEARERLQAPELAWADGAAGDVEVFDHLAAEGDGDGEEDSGGADGAAPSAAAHRGNRMRDVLVLGASALAVVIGAVLLVVR